MEGFVRTVKIHDIQATLERALSGRKPFRSFTDELLRFPDIREQWFAYHAERMKEIARDWLEENDMNLTAETSSSLVTCQHCTLTRERGQFQAPVDLKKSLIVVI